MTVKHKTFGAAFLATLLLTATAIGPAIAQRAALPAGADAGAAAAAANAFLGVLISTQKAKAQYAYESDKKATWHNFPPQMMPRAGVTLGELSSAQRDYAMNVLSTVLSPYGVDKVLRTMDADKYLGTDMGAGFPTGPDAYSLAVFGTPSPTQPWAIQFNGHHLGLNVAISGRDRTMAPSLTGAYPAVYTRDGKQVRVLAEETDRAYALINALDETKRRQAVLPYVVFDLVLGPGHDREMIQPEGLKASAMTAGERQLLLDLVSAWVNIMNESAADAKLAAIRSTLDETYFAWSGGTRPGSNIYFRVQGPTTFIEYSTQVNPGGEGRGQRGGGGPRGAGQPPGGGARDGGGRGPNGEGRNARGPNGEDRRDPNHVHAVYRDFTNDYGSRLAQR